MLKFFRKIRQNLISEGNTGKYLKYALGEIVLVVIGILVALQINNSNEVRKTRDKELIYLNNIKEDLRLNIKELEEYSVSRDEAINSIALLMGFFEGKKDLNLNKFNLNNLNVLVWYPFIQNANTYQELMNSGNLSLIANKEIKNELQNMQKSYERIKFIENEMQQDYENYLYDPYFSTADLNTNLKNYSQQLNNEKLNSKEELEIDPSEVVTLLNNRKYKNGLVLASYNSDLLKVEYQSMIVRAQRLIELIDNESNK